MSKIAQAEYKAKTCFQALLRRRRFSRRSLKEHSSRMQSQACLDYAEAKLFFEAKLQRSNGAAPTYRSKSPRVKTSLGLRRWPRSLSMNSGCQVRTWIWGTSGLRKSHTMNT